MTIRADNIGGTRGGRRIFDGVSFTLAPGTALMLKGPNGSGKTTLLRILAGLQPADRGTLSADPETLIFAGHLDGAKATLTVAENLRFWAGLFGQSDIDAALAAFDLDGLADRRAAHLSAGQRRRLGLARLLVAKRDVWLLDEPTTSLDAATTGRFAAIVTDHLGAGGSAVIATHIDLAISAGTLDMADFPALEAVADPFGEALS